MRKSFNTCLFGYFGPPWHSELRLIFNYKPHASKNVFPPFFELESWMKRLTVQWVISMSVTQPTACRTSPDCFYKFNALVDSQIFSSRSHNLCIIFHNMGGGWLSSQDSGFIASNMHNGKFFFKPLISHFQIYSLCRSVRECARVCESVRECAGVSAENEKNSNI